MKQKRILFIALLFLFAACKFGNKNRFNVTGNITDMPVQEVVLEEIGVNDVITVVDSTKSTEAGHFQLSGIAPEPGLYRLRFEQNKFILLAVEKGDLSVTADWQSLEAWKVSGSDASESLRKFLLAIREHLRDFNTMSVVIDTLVSRGNDSLLTKAKTDFRDMREKFTRYVEQYADTTKYLPVAVFAARILNPGSEKPFLDAFSQGLDRRFPNSKMVKDFLAYNGQAGGMISQQQKTAAMPEIGKMAPEINLQDINGKNISLSSLRGKYVLLDFWASWCNPCRMENPNVVAAYSKYKDKNFTVFSVSLDSDKDKWQKAIAQDGLSWSAHVSDLKGWESVAAKTYRIESIPSNFLIDASGKIIASNLRGDLLEQKLAEILK